MLYCSAAVRYQGRAKSSLKKGQFVLIYKPDGSFSIHGSRSIKPLNYQNANTKIEIVGNQRAKDGSLFKIVARNGKEVIRVTVYAVLSTMMLEDWTVGSIKLKGTERELRDHLVKEIRTNLGDQFEVIETEYPTTYGSIDIYLLEADKLVHIFEVKRHKINMAACGQLERYARYFLRRGFTVHQYLAAPTISKNAVKYAKDHGQTWVKANLPS